MSAISLRPADRAADEAFLFAVYASTRDAEMDLVDWSDDQKQSFLEMQHDAQAREFDRRFPDADYDIVVELRHDVGRLWVAREPDEIRVLDITLLPEFRGRGIGTELFERLQSEATERGIPLRDSVFQGNPRAAALYERLGFVRTGESGAYWSMEWTP